MKSLEDIISGYRYKTMIGIDKHFSKTIKYIVFQHIIMKFYNKFFFASSDIQLAIDLKYKKNNNEIS